MMDYRAYRKKLIELSQRTNMNLGELLRPFAVQYGLTLTQSQILVAVKEKGPVTVGNLGKLIGMDSGNISTMCKKLEKNGFLRRTRQEHDERVVSITLTQQGEDAIAAMGDSVDQQLQPIWKQETPETLDMIIDALEKINDIAEKATGKAPVM